MQCQKRKRRRGEFYIAEAAERCLCPPLACINEPLHRSGSNATRCVILHHYSTRRNNYFPQESLKNPYRSALFRCAGMIKKPPSAADKEEKEAVVPDDGEGATSSEDAVSFRVDFPRLFSTLSSTLSADESTLLLYLLLHQNAEFRSHVLASSDVEKVSGQLKVQGDSAGLGPGLG